MNEEINELKTMLNDLYIQFTLTSCRCNVLEELLLGRELDKHPNEFKAVYTRYVDELQKVTEERFINLEKELINAGEIGHVIKQKITFFESIQNMKKSEDYLA